MKISDDEHRYDDIIGLSHYRSKTRPPMSMTDRAAQFSPFAALTGYDDAVRETARSTDYFEELDEEAKSRLDEKLQIITQHLLEFPRVTVTFFRPDERKSGGSYRNIVGAVKKIDRRKRCVVMEDETEISVNFIRDITGHLFDRFES